MSPQVRLPSSPNSTIIIVFIIAQRNKKSESNADVRQTALGLDASQEMRRMCGQREENSALGEDYCNIRRKHTSGRKEGSQIKDERSHKRSLTANTVGFFFLLIIFRKRSIFSCSSSHVTLIIDYVDELPHPPLISFFSLPKIYESHLSPVIILKVVTINICFSLTWISSGVE